MSYDLAVWVGPAPADDAAAAAEFRRRQGGSGPASAPIAALVADLLRQFPEEDPDDSPWAAGPLLAEAGGDFLHFAMTVSGAQRAYGPVVETVRRHGLVCFDPQTGRVVAAPPRRGLFRRGRP